MGLNPIPVHTSSPHDVNHLASCVFLSSCIFFIINAALLNRKTDKRTPELTSALDALNSNTGKVRSSVAMATRYSRSNE